MSRAELAKLFPDDDFRSHHNPTIKALPQLARPLVEYIHDTKPDIVIAGDRGGRLYAGTVKKSWRHRFPQDPFPTIDGKIHLARVTSRSASWNEVVDVTKLALRRAGLDTLQNTARNDGLKPNVMYIDDWAVYGGTIQRFIDAAEEVGVPADAITYATICGEEMDFVRHFVADPGTRSGRSAWDSEGGMSDYVGVDFNRGRPTVPILNRNEHSVEVRRSLTEFIDAYYAEFDAATAAGALAACACTATRTS